MGGGGAGISSTMKLGLIPFKRETTTLSFWLKKREKVWITTFNGGIGNTFYIPYLSPSMWTWRGGVNEVQNYNKVETMIQDMKLPFKIEEGKIRICHVFMQQDNPAATVAGLPQTHTVLPGAIRIIKDTEGLINESHKICKATGKDYPTTKEQYTMNIGESLPRICQNTSDPPDNGILGTNKNLIFRRAGHIEEVTPDEEWTHSVKFGRTGGHYYKSSEWQQIRGPGNAEGVYLDMDYALQGENNTTLGGNDYNKDITNRQYGGQGIIYGKSRQTYPLLMVQGMEMRDYEGTLMNQRVSFDMETALKVSIVIEKGWGGDTENRMAHKYQLEFPRTRLHQKTVDTADVIVDTPYRHFT